MSSNWRLTSFALAVVLLAALLGWAARTVWHEMQQLRRSYAAVESHAFHLSEYIEAQVRDLKETLLLLDARKDPSQERDFLGKAEGLRRWIGAHQTPLTTAREGELMKQVEAAFAVYLSSSTSLMQQISRPQTSAPHQPVWEAVENNSAGVLALCKELAEAERISLRQFLTDSRDSLEWLQVLFIALLLLLLGLGGIVGLSVYRELLAPLQSQLRRSRAIIERHEKLASLGTLAAGVAHEVRNPLTAINVRLHSLKRSLVEGTSEHEDATVIDNEIRRLESIVQEFLQFARPSEPKFVTVSADSLLAKVRRLLAGQLENSAIALDLEAPSDVWLRVDPQQIEQVLINLVQNAAESIERDGTIRLSARHDSGRLAGRARPIVVLQVSDSGKGIPPQVQKRLFDPFFTTKENGTGLGLSIAARIVEQQGGLLRYKTELNRGTTFEILLPQVKKQLDEPSS